jgi:hypothetical protein
MTTFISTNKTTSRRLARQKRPLPQPLPCSRASAASRSSRLKAVWDSLPGVAPVKSFKSAKAAASRIWERIQTLAPVPPVAVLTEPKVDKTAKRGARVVASGQTGSLLIYSDFGRSRLPLLDIFWRESGGFMPEARLGLWCNVWE